MKKLILLWSIILLLSSCSTIPHEKTTFFPTEKPEGNAEVAVIRPYAFTKGGICLLVLLDQRAIHCIATSEYITFFVKAGEHSVQATSERFFTEDMYPPIPFKQEFKAGEKYYFLIEVLDFWAPKLRIN
jgi:hypothetical protein